MAPKSGKKKAAAKKAPAKKAAVKAAAKKSAAPKRVARSAGAASRKSTARSQVMPGFEQVRNSRLDNICEGIAAERGVKNAAALEEASLTSTALQVMQEKGVTVHKHAGVELVRVPGADKLRVRLTKETGDAGVDGGVSRGSADDEEGAPDIDDDAGMGDFDHAEDDALSI